MFAQQLKTAMRERGITQTELSTRTGISKSGISQYLSGIHKPGDKALTALADALDVPEEYLVGDNKPIDCTITTARSVPIKLAAKLMGKGEQFIRIGLQRGTLPIGYAVKKDNKYSYYISPKKFMEVTGVDLTRGEELA